MISKHSAYITIMWTERAALSRRGKTALAMESVTHTFHRAEFLFIDLATGRWRAHLFGVPQASLPGALYRGLHRWRRWRQLFHCRTSLEHRHTQSLRAHRRGSAMASAALRTQGLLGMSGCGPPGGAPLGEKRSGFVMRE